MDSRKSVSQMTDIELQDKAVKLLSSESWTAYKRVHNSEKMINLVVEYQNFLKSELKATDKEKAKIDKIITDNLFTRQELLTGKKAFTEIGKNKPPQEQHKEKSDEIQKLKKQVHQQEKNLEMEKHEKMIELDEMTKTSHAAARNQTDEEGGKEEYFDPENEEVPTLQNQNEEENDEEYLDPEKEEETPVSQKKVTFGKEETREFNEKGLDPIVKIKPVKDPLSEEIPVSSIQPTQHPQRRTKSRGDINKPKVDINLASHLEGSDQPTFNPTEQNQQQPPPAQQQPSGWFGSFGTALYKAGSAMYNVGANVYGNIVSPPTFSDMPQVTQPTKENLTANEQAVKDQKVALDAAEKAKAPTRESISETITKFETVVNNNKGLWSNNFGDTDVTKQTLDTITVWKNTLKNPTFKDFTQLQREIATVTNTYNELLANQLENNETDLLSSIQSTVNSAKEQKRSREEATTQSDEVLKKQMIENILSALKKLDKQINEIVAQYAEDNKSLPSMSKVIESRNKWGAYLESMINNSQSISLHDFESNTNQILAGINQLLSFTSPEATTQKTQVLGNAETAKPTQTALGEIPPPPPDDEIPPPPEEDETDAATTGGIYSHMPSPTKTPTLAGGTPPKIAPPTTTVAPPPGTPAPAPTKAAPPPTTVVPPPGTPAPAPTKTPAPAPTKAAPPPGGTGAPPVVLPPGTSPLIAQQLLVMNSFIAEHEKLSAAIATMEDAIHAALAPVGGGINEKEKAALEYQQQRVEKVRDALEAHELTLNDAKARLMGTHTPGTGPVAILRSELNDIRKAQEMVKTDARHAEEMLSDRVMRRPTDNALIAKPTTPELALPRITNAASITRAIGIIQSTIDQINNEPENHTVYSAMTAAQSLLTETTRILSKLDSVSGLSKNEKKDFTTQLNNLEKSAKQLVGPTTEKELKEEIKRIENLLHAVRINPDRHSAYNLMATGHNLLNAANRALSRVELLPPAYAPKQSYTDKLNDLAASAAQLPETAIARFTNSYQKDPVTIPPGGSYTAELDRQLNTIFPDRVSGAPAARAPLAVLESNAPGGIGKFNKDQFTISIDKNGPSFKNATVMVQRYEKNNIRTEVHSIPDVIEPLKILKEAFTKKGIPGITDDAIRKIWHEIQASGGKLVDAEIKKILIKNGVPDNFFSGARSVAEEFRKTYYTAMNRHTGLMIEQVIKWVEEHRTLQKGTLRMTEAPSREWALIAMAYCTMSKYSIDNRAYPNIEEKEYKNMGLFSERHIDKFREEILHNKNARAAFSMTAEAEKKSQIAAQKDAAEPTPTIKPGRSP